MSEPAKAGAGTIEPKLGRAKDQPAHIKETLISLIIAFVMAFVFRAFVVEAFIIPTGSMAPTLLGAHSRFQSRETGYNWPSNPPHGPAAAAYTVEAMDPMTGEKTRVNARRRTGDRILVFKYLYQVYEPRRWDVVVFKAPHDPQTNFIKRLVGLPNEQIALIDGDVWVRTPAAGESASPGVDAWSLPGWSIQRKPERVQRTVWQDVYWSQYEPLNPVRDSLTGSAFESPWLGGAGWTIDGERSYTYGGTGPTTLEWETRIRPIVDRYAYDEMYSWLKLFPVGDLNMSAGVEPVGGPVEAAAAIRARGHEFRAEVRGRSVSLKMGELADPDAGWGSGGPTQWREIARGELEHELAPGRVTNIEFWHVDQALELWADGKLVASGVYDWTPEERLRRSTSLTLGEVVARDRVEGNSLAEQREYRMPGVRWEFSGPVTLHRVGLQRDLYYQPGERSDPGYVNQPARATHPLASPRLGPDHFFVLGDNSPMSADSRLWEVSEEWVREQIDPAEGIVPRKLLIGRAFFVYFPALDRGGWSKLPVPDFGRMRWIW